MCGIGFIKRMGEKPIEPWQVQVLACSLEHRGNDATGLAVQMADGTIHVHKDHEPAWKFLAQGETTTWLKKQLDNPEHHCVLVHTRKMTKGTQFVNKNNHPMFSGKCAVVHNGMISNDDWLFKDMKLDRGAETDSDIIRAIVDEEGLTRKLIGHSGKLNRLVGSVASFVVHPEFPKTLLLLRSNNPLFIGSNREHLCGASTKRSCYMVLKSWVNRWGINQQVNDGDLAFIGMPNNTGWLMKDKLEWHDVFTASNYQKNITYNVHNPDWYRKRREQEQKARDAERAKEYTEEKKPPPQSRAVVLDTRNVTTHEAVALAKVTPTIGQSRRPDYVLCQGKHESGTRCDNVISLTDLPAGAELFRYECDKCFTNLAESVPCNHRGVPVE